MAELIRMPEVLAGVAEAAIQTWLVAEGAVVAIGQPLAEIETDKAMVELTAEAQGTIGRLLVGEGESVVVGDPILVMLGAGEGVEAVAAALSADDGGQAVAEPVDAPPALAPTPAAPEPETAPEPESAPEPKAAPVPAAHDALSTRTVHGQRLFVSPLVRRLAVERGVNLSAVMGTGPNGRIVRRDLESHLQEPLVEPVTTSPAASSAGSASVEPARVDSASFEDIPLDRVRRAVARRLSESKSTVPHFYLVADCRVDDLLALRAQVNQHTPRKISVNDFVLKAVAAALKEVPRANAVWNGDSIRQFSSVDISVAVATDTGLTTPVLRGVERMPLTQVSATVADIAQRARGGRLRQHEIEGGSFSVSNLGMYGTTQFSAILNPPQSGILAVGAARKLPIVAADGELGIGTVMTVTLSADHRVFDGAVAAEWLAAFQRRIENPLTILL